MIKTYIVKPDELEVIKEVSKKIQSNTDVKDVIMTKIGLDVVHIFVELMYNENLNILVPDDYEFDARYLAGSKGDIIRHYHFIMKNNEKYKKTDEYKEYCKIKHDLEPPYYPGVHLLNMIDRVNPHHPIKGDDEYDLYRIVTPAWRIKI